jgi:DNA polymerase (family 10)
MEKAIADGYARGREGDRAKKIDAIKAGIEQYKARGGGGCQSARRHPRSARAGGGTRRGVRKIAGVIRAEVAGSLRRRRETIADVDIVGARQGYVRRETIDGGVRASLPGDRADVLVHGAEQDERENRQRDAGRSALVPEENFGAALLYFTGSKEHNVKIRGLALKKEDDAQRVGPVQAR